MQILCLSFPRLFFAFCKSKLRACKNLVTTFPNLSGLLGDFFPQTKTGLMFPIVELSAYNNFSLHANLKYSSFANEQVLKRPIVPNLEIITKSVSSPPSILTGGKKPRMRTLKPVQNASWPPKNIRNDDDLYSAVSTGYPTALHNI